jgi:uncharacterized protein
MLGKDNGWEKTPRLRLSLLGYNRPSDVNRIVTSYPPSEFSYLKLYLNASSSQLQEHAPQGEDAVSYDASLPYDTTLRAHRGIGFTYKFTKYTELCGFSRVKLFMSTPDADDMDVYVVIRKLNAAGDALFHYNIPFSALPAGTKETEIPHENVWKYVGPSGRLRASNRATGEEKLEGISPQQYRELMSDAYVYHPYNDNRKLEHHEVVELDIGLWPGGIIFDAGESMRLEIKGVRPILPEFVGLGDKNYNRGTHVLHTGGEHASYLYVSLS